MRALRNGIGRFVVALARLLRPEEFEAVRAKALRQGRREALSSLSLELSYSVSVLGLLQGPAAAAVPQHLRKAFELLLQVEPYSLTQDQELAQLQDLGLSLKRALLLIRWRDSRPETLVALLLAVLSGMPEDQAWRIAHKQ